MSRNVIIFYDAAFPGSPGLDDSAVEALRQLGTVVAAADLAFALGSIRGGCFVNLHAPYFPKTAWPEIHAFLRRGGGLISIGGAPFKIPVRPEEGGWTPEAEQTAYHRELFIHETLRVNAGPVKSLAASDRIPLLAGREALFEIRDTWNLVPHTTRNCDFPHEMGSAGTMNTQVYPLLKGISNEGREVAAPVVLWENSRGDFEGSRWLFVNLPLSKAFWEQGGVDALAEWSNFCADPVTELSITTNYASYEPGEHAVLMLQMQRIAKRDDAEASNKRWTFEITVEQDEGDQYWAQRFAAEVTKSLDFVRIPVPLDIQSGLYRVVCRASSEDGETRVLRHGFWGNDAELLAKGSPVTCGRDYFVKDGRPLPIVGMTYMASDVARKFLFLPNPDVWDRDMSQMAKAGINWIRTGLWTAYRNVMQVDGHASEEVLRAIDAFILTAKKHDLQVTFTFFSFTPETWEGVNPYLDPQSVEAQKRFIRSIVHRHRATSNVDWDLINEPSMFDPKRIFASGPRSCGDRFEREAFSAWLKERHGRIELLQERWNMTPEQLPSFAAAAIPGPQEINFDVQDMILEKKGTRWLDYCLFSMDMHNRWAKQLYAEIKELNPNQLVTVGQDEALGAQRPSPFFYQEAVDYTTVHSWWLNDDLVWDGVFAKTADKPNVIQETGIMYVETPEGRAKRSEEELRSILERKYAYAFATGGAGAIHWIWNTNFYMDNANESHIGALRADGTEKPETDVSYAFGKFMGEIRDLFEGRELEEVAVIFPYSNDFSNRKLAYEATTRLTRVLSYQLNIPFRGVSEYDLRPLENDPAKLILLPSAHNIDGSAWERLLGIVKRTGATLLVTGPISIDAYWRKTDRLADLLGEAQLRNVRREEMLCVDGKEIPVSYGKRRIAEVSKETRSGGPLEAAPGSTGGDAVRNIPLGNGRLIWCPLPIELNDRTDSMAELYRYAIAEAGCGSGFEWTRGDVPGIYGRKLTFKDGSLYVFVSEYALDTSVEVADKDTGATYAFELEQERSVLFAADAEGRIISVYRPHEVKINTKP
ncbi:MULTISPECIES: beta-galactosidase [Paenibacillus]|uniref:Glycoside hydrolase family 42 N-terminal domain-containing protein n=1 Tax=Paenibacillus albilobatus TaxID=2716884 RepID=A0A919XH99_9BACL|nr:MULTISPECIES: beta-galactosidase [Paenibacillus]GIO31694.1 hypothetical protein J2TS6_28350 [Paenibacillus albilobatus]